MEKQPTEKEKQEYWLDYAKEKKNRINKQKFGSGCRQMTIQSLRMIG